MDLSLPGAIHRHGQVVDILVSKRRDGAAARAFFTRALKVGLTPVEVTTDRAPAYPRIIDELVPGARHVLDQYANNVVEADHGRLKARLRPMRGLKRMRSLRTIVAGHAFVQNLRRGHYELAVDVPANDRVRAAFTELSLPLTRGYPRRPPARPNCSQRPTQQSRMLMLLCLASWPISVVSSGSMDGRPVRCG